MAVLRATRLWTAQLMAGLVKPAQNQPGRPLEETHSGVRSTTAYVYTVPPGKKAIIRTITSVLNGIPPSGEEPTVKYYLEPFNTGAAYEFHYFWFVDHTTSTMEGVWRIESNWSGNITLNAGDKVRAVLVCTRHVMSVGSGMLLNEQQ